MSRDTDFDFGANVNWRSADNLDPWGQGKPTSTEQGTGAGRKVVNGNALSDRKHTSILSDPAPVSDTENILVDIAVEAVVDYVRKQIRIMGREVRKVATKHMSPSAAEMLKNASNGSGNLLHGSDVPKKTSKFTIDVIAFRMAPEGFQGSMGLLDIKPIWGCEAWALNKTNFKAVMGKFGDNTDKWKGKLTLQVIQVRNPKTGTFGPSLAVAA